MSQIPIEKILKEDNLEDLKIALKQGYNVNTPNKFLRTLLHLAVINNCSKEMIEFVLQNGADIEAKDQKQCTPLLYAVKGGNNIEIVKVLIKHGANINAMDSDDSSVLHIAVMLKHIEAVQLLIKCGANINERGFKNYTTFQTALCVRNNLKILEYLVEHGANVDAIVETGGTSLHLASRFKNNVENIKFLLDHGFDINVTQNGYLTPLHIAVSIEQNIENVEFLLENGADISTFDVISVIHRAVLVKNNVDVLKLLLERGMDVNVKNNSEETPLHAAVEIQKDNLENIKFLLKNGADVNCQDANGDTPLFYSICNGNKIYVKEVMNLSEIDYAHITEDIGDLYDSEFDVQDILEATKTVLSHMVHLKILHLLTEESFEVWRTDETLNTFLNQHEKDCREEFEKMEKELICQDRKINFAEILTKKLRIVANYLNVKDVKDQLQRISLNEKFPNFSNLLGKRIDEAGNLAELISKSYVRLQEICFKGRLPYIVSNSIFNYLDVKDMTNLISV